MTTISGILLFFCYHPPKFRLLHKHQTKLEILRHFDWVGLVVFVGAITVTLLGISWGGQEYRESMKILEFSFVNLPPYCLCLPLRD